MGVLNVGQRIEEQAEFEKIYKNGNFIYLTISMCHMNSTNLVYECPIMFLCVLSNQHGLTMPMHVLYNMQEQEP